MPWVRPVVDDSRYGLRQLSEVAGTTKFLLDNNVDADLLDFLDGQGLSARLLPYKQINESDEEVLAEAWRQDRVLITHDPGFLNENEHPPEKNPGIVVIPGGSGDLSKHLFTINAMLQLMKPYRGLWLQTYVHIKDGGTITIKGINATYGGRIEPWHLRFDPDGQMERWVDEAV